MSNCLIDFMGLFRLTLLRLLLSFLFLGGNPITITVLGLLSIRRKTLWSPVKILLTLSLSIRRTVIQEIALLCRRTKPVTTPIGYLIL